MVRMEIGEVQTQTESVKAFCTEMKTAVESMSRATQGVGLATGLQGQTFDSIKSYLGTVYPALAKAFTLLAEEAEQANQNYVDGYTGEFGNVTLDSDELQDNIQQIQQLIHAMEEQKAHFQRLNENLKEVPGASLALDYVIRTFQRTIERNQTKKEKVEEKLQKFLAFDAQSSSYFAGIDGQMSLVSSGLQSIGMSADGKTLGAGTWNGNGFSGLSNGDWIKTVNGQWTEREKKQEAKLAEKLQEYTIIKCTDVNGKVTWALEKDGLSVSDSEALAYLRKINGNMDQKKYDIVAVTPEEWTARVNEAWKKNKDYFSGNEIPISWLAHGQDWVNKQQENGVWDAMWSVGMTVAAVRGAQTSEKSSVTKNIIKNNLGNEIDITPSKNHTTVNKNPGPFNGNPNSSIDILDSKGKITTRRFYDETGKAIRDIDMTNHGNPKNHPEYPHEHKWKYDSDGKPTRE